MEKDKPFKNPNLDATPFGVAKEKRILLSRQITYLFIGITSIKLILELISLDFFGTGLTLVLLFCFSITLYFNTIGKYDIGRNYLFFIVGLSFCLLHVLFGRGFGVEFGYFPLIGLAGIFFEKPREKISYALFLGLTYLASLVYLFYYPPVFVENLSSGTYYFMLLASAISLYKIIMLYLGENARSEQKNEALFKDLKSKKDDLEKVNQELERFVFIASHDLKTPLRNISSFLNLIQRKLKKDQSDEVGEYLEFAIQNSKRMHALVEDVLEFSQVNKEKQSFEKVNINQVLEKALFNLENFIQEKSAEVTVGKFPTILGNESQLVTLFQNLIHNGIKYNFKVRPRISICCQQEDNEFVIHVKDNGIGIEQKYQKRVFDMFYRLHNQGEFEGSGIGLATCLKIMTFHGGSIAIHNRQTGGCVFSLRFPISGAHLMRTAVFEGKVSQPVI